MTLTLNERLLARLEDPQDDPALGALGGRFMERFVTPRERLAGLGYRAAQGAVGALGGTVEAGGLALERAAKTLGPLIGDATPETPIAQRMQTIGQWLSTSAEGLRPKKATASEGLAAEVAGGVGSAAGFVGQTLLGGGALRLAGVAPRTAALISGMIGGVGGNMASGYLDALESTGDRDAAAWASGQALASGGSQQDAAQAYGRVMRETGNKEVAFHAALVNGLIVGPTELAGLGNVTRLAKILARAERTTGGAVGTAIVKTMFEESAQEGFGQFVQNLGAHFLEYDKDRKLWEGVVKNAAVGGLAGVVLGGPLEFVAGLGTRRSRIAQERGATPEASGAMAEAKPAPAAEQGPSGLSEGGKVQPVEQAPSPEGVTEPETATPLGAEPVAPEPSAPGPRVVPREEKLSEIDLEIQERFASQIERDPQAAIAEYEKRFGNVVNTDNARELSEDYLADRSRSAAVHEPSSWLVKKLYAQLLSRPTAEGKKRVVLFTAGGTGAGKTSAIEQVPAMRELASKAGIIYDTNVNDAGSARKKIDQALAAGFPVSIAYVYRDPVDALVRGALPRAAKQEAKHGTGRTVPLSVHGETHLQSRAAVEELRRVYAGNPDVNFFAIDNSRGLGKAAEVPFEELPIAGYTPGALHDALRQALEAERAAGRISERIFQGFAGDSSRVPGQPGRGEGQLREAAERERAGLGSRVREALEVAARPPPEAQPAVTVAPQAVAPPELPTSPEPAVVAAAPPLPPSLIAKRPGSAGGLELAGGETIPITYALVDAADLIPSHDPRRGFAKNPLGDINERPYDDPIEGRPMRETVLGIAENPKPQLLTTDTPSAVDGPPIVTSRGVVLGGNARAMGMQLAYHRGGPTGETIRTAMLAAAGRFGIQGAELIKQPVLVRMVKEGQEGAPGELSRILNESLTTGKGVSTEAVSRGSKVTPAVAREIAQIVGDGTLREALGIRIKAEGVARALVIAGAMSERDLVSLFDPNTHLPTQGGKQIIEDALLGSVVQDVRALAALPASTRNALLRALPSLVTLKGKIPGLPGMMRHVAEGMAEVSQTGQPLADVIGQTVLPGIDVGWKQDQSAIGIVRALLNEKPTKVAERFERLATRARELSTGQVSFLAEENLPIEEQLANEFAGEVAGVSEMFAGPPLKLGLLPLAKVQKFFQKHFRWHGLMPREAGQELERMRAEVEAEISEVAQRARELDRAVSAVHGRGWQAKAIGRTIDAAFEDPSRMAALPRPIALALVAMRNHTDRVSRLLIKSGAVDPQSQLAATILGNLGTYSKREYRAFNDIDHASKVPENVKRRFLSLMLSEGKTLAEGKSIMEVILEEAREVASNPFAHIASSRLGSKDLSIFKHRKSVPEELRALLGEVNDPLANYANSVVRMAAVIAKHKAYGAIREKGLAAGWLSEPGRRMPGHSATLRKEGNPAIAPLDGMHTTPEVKDALNGPASVESAKWLRAFMRANSAIKWGKVIGQPTAFARNLLSNVTIAIANGHMPLWIKLSAWKHAFGKGSLLERKRLIGLGILGEGINTYEWDDLRNALKRTPEEIVKAQSGLYERTTGALETLYAAADNLPKVMGFYAEEAALLEAGLSPEEAERTAADRIRDLYPTPQRMALVLKGVRAQPFLGQYFAFRAEMFRTAVHRMRLIAQEVKSANPKIRRMGIERATGQLIAAGLSPAAVLAWGLLNGIDNDEDKDRREFLPPWDVDNEIIWFGSETQGTYVDFSDIDPMTLFTDPALRVLAGADADTTMHNWLTDQGLTFFGPSPISTLAVELYTRETRTGRPIDDLGEYVWKAIQPGVFGWLAREKERGFDVSSLASFALARRYIFDVEKTLMFDVRGFAREMSEATSRANREIRSGVDEAEARITQDNARRRAFGSLQVKLAAAGRLGVESDVLRKMLHAELSAEMAEAILTGRYLPYRSKAPVMAIP